jgi:hypothetical protein
MHKGMEAALPAWLMFLDRVYKTQKKRISVIRMEFNN